MNENIKAPPDEEKHPDDSVVAFLENRTEKTLGAYIYRNVLYSSYEQYCLEGGYSPVSKTQFHKQLRMLGYRFGPTRHSGLCFKGIKIK